MGEGGMVESKLGTELRSQVAQGGTMSPVPMAGLASPLQQNRSSQGCRQEPHILNRNA